MAEKTNDADLPQRDAGGRRGYRPLITGRSFARTSRASHQREQREQREQAADHRADRGERPADESQGVFRPPPASTSPA